MAVMTDTDFEQLLMLIVSGKSVSEASVELGYDDHGSAANADGSCKRA